MSHFFWFLPLKVDVAWQAHLAWAPLLQCVGCRKGSSLWHFAFAQWPALEYGVAAQRPSLLLLNSVHENIDGTSAPKCNCECLFLFMYQLHTYLPKDSSSGVLLYTYPALGISVACTAVALLTAGTLCSKRNRWSHSIISLFQYKSIILLWQQKVGAAGFASVLLFCFSLRTVCVPCFSKR